MAYPRLLNLDDDVKERLISQIKEWIADHRSERSEWDQQLEYWQEDYWADPWKQDGVNDGNGGCKIIIPLTAIAVETNHAALMGTIFPSGQLLSAKGKLPQSQGVAPTWQRFINDQFTNHIKLRESMESAFLEIEKFGTGVAKAEYCKIVKYGIREIDGVEVPFPVTVKNNVEVRTVPLGKYWQPFSDVDAQFAPFCGELHHFSRSRFRQACKDGLFYEDLYEELEGRFSTQDDETDNQFESNQQDLEGKNPSFPEELKVFEFWCEFPVEGEDEVPREIQLFYNEDSQELCGVFYNQSPLLQRPYRSGNYIKVEHRWAGIGICKQNDQFQLEVTVQHRQRIDNATLANMRMFKIAKMSGYGPNEKVFPGKMWFLDSMDDIETLQLGEIYPSAYNNEQQTLLYSQQRVGVNENTLGMPQVGTPGTATSDIARLQEAKRKFDYVVNNVKAFTLDIVYDCLDLIKLYGVRQSYTKFSPIEDQIIQAILNGPFESFRHSTLFDHALVGAQTNKILDRQNWQQVSGFLTQYYTQMLTLAQQTGNAQLMQLLSQKALVGGTEAMRQILETFDIQSIERILPIKEFLENGTQGDAIGGGNIGAPTGIQDGRMANPNGLPGATV